MPRTNRIKATPGNRRMTELLLAENVPNVGEQGQIVRVRAGFARNYLVPQGLATIATDENKAAVEEHRKRQDEQRKQQIKAWKADPLHAAAQAKGKANWYSSYKVQVVKVLREYDSP